MLTARRILKTYGFKLSLIEHLVFFTILMQKLAKNFP